MFGVFDPQGPVALQERNLIITAVALMLLVAIPLLVALYMFAWKYRAGNKKAKYEPEHVGSAPRQLLWWAIPAVIILVIAIINWKSTHALDPTRSLASNAKPLTIQVVALEWKWLFIYPEQGIATVNFIQFPAQTPIHFELTADGPMSSFWIPQLGSQIYAMAAMQTQLNLMADTTGEFVGKDTEINGAGYAGMNFIAKATSQNDFEAWVGSVKQAAGMLDPATYNALAAPSKNNPVAYYASVDGGLYNSIMMKFMTPSSAEELPGIQVAPMAPAAPVTQPTSAMPGMRM